jgi:cyclophilin family peptidyl-prolyl cis-trans isomerase
MKIGVAKPFAALLAVLAVGCQQANEEAAAPSQSSPASVTGQEAKLKPLSGNEDRAPALTQVTTVRLETDAGDVVIEVYPQAAPNAVRRFVELVTSGFYDDTPISRVVPGFVAQFGINWRDPHKAWDDRPFNDDPSHFQLERGTLAFAKGGRPGTASTQVFINYRENNRLADPSPQLSFWVFGKVVEGMDVVDKFVQVGDPSDGLDQNRLWADGGAYLASLPVKPTMIEKATVVE